LFVDLDRFLADKSEDAKAFHHRFARIGLQESSPQNNFRRIIAAYVPAGEFCNHTVNYCPSHKVTIDLHFILALLNSKLADWYFRLGSTNAHVSHYQLYNLPCPQFSKATNTTTSKVQAEARAALERGNTRKVFDILRPLMMNAPFNPALATIIVEATKHMIRIEAERGEIARAERSALDPEAQPFQDLIDQLFYKMAGLTDDEIVGLEERLANML
jgi:hypothetical protein